MAFEADQSERLDHAHVNTAVSLLLQTLAATTRNH